VLLDILLMSMSMVWLTILARGGLKGLNPTKQSSTLFAVTSLSSPAGDIVRHMLDVKGGFDGGGAPGPP
jgi:hypothetical protein